MTRDLETQLQILQQKELALAISRKYLRKAGIRLVEEIIRKFNISPKEIRWPKKS